ncbi:NACHT, LRR and PYD domains-containing protein 3-like isoform X1 [Carcharodon carcharias]|uniref:NACHT, LRR and PYD domains-containing protein 3-like isoform X1 n=1 Tax=Carcharodon carcharias TaxID=13397 RepID=UPI001B7EF7D9|nr:NACHT, LRR and PYD domains-containing protein 3-like isoform X1 [Carcharodon carcharias]
MGSPGREVAGESRLEAAVPGGERISSLQLLRRNRVKLVDELGDRINWILDHALQIQIISEDDYEDVKYNPGPRRKVRALLDIIDCRGEVVADQFCSLFDKSKDVSEKETVSKEHSTLIKKHKQVLGRRNEVMMYYNTRPGEKIHLSDQFTNLLLVKGHHSLEFKRHELLSFGQHRIHLQDRSSQQMDIQPGQLFLQVNDKQAPKITLVSGVAGIGKTVLLQKLVYDWANNQCFDNFEFILQFTFRDLNLINKPMSFRNLILKKNGHLSKALDSIFQTAEKLLIILDGFDEFKSGSCLDGDCYITDPDEEGNLVDIIHSLLRGELLIGASVLLTSRPTAIHHIPVETVDRFVIITGFSEREIRNFFLRYYRDGELGCRMFQQVKGNDFLFTLCFVPAFCYIVCSVLKEKEGEGQKQAKTMADIYSRYLSVLLKHHSRAQSSGEQQLTQTLRNLTTLAYSKLLQHDTLFYQHDLEAHHIELNTFVDSFLDKTTVQEPECVVSVFSFTHFTIQEFFAALHYVLEPEPFPDLMNEDTMNEYKMSSGFLDIFQRFLSGLLSDRNQALLSKHMKLDKAMKSKSYCYWLLEGIKENCENGTSILNLLHCLFEQQNDSLAERVKPKNLRIHVGDNLLCPMDFSVLKYFLDMKIGDLEELDLTATNINSAALKNLQPYLHQCERLWCGENKLDFEAIKFLCELLKSPDYKLKLLGLGWTDIGNNELRELCDALKDNKTLQELWVEGNNADYDGISGFTAIPSTNTTLKKVVLVGHCLQEEDLVKLSQSLKPSNSGFLITGFSNDHGQWKGWCDWVLQRCQLCDNEKLVHFLIKIFNKFLQNQTFTWMSQWCKELQELLQDRIRKCKTEETKNKLQKLKETISRHC